MIMIVVYLLFSFCHIFLCLFIRFFFQYYPQLVLIIIDILWCVKRDVAEQSKAKQKSYKVVVPSRRGAARYVELLAGKNAFWAPIDGDL